MKTFYELQRRPREEVILNQPHSWLGVIMPERSMNLIYDPETLGYAHGNTTYYGIGCSIESDPAVQKRGLGSIKVGDFTDNLNRVAYNLVQGISANVPYTFSVDHLGGNGLNFVLMVERVSDSKRLAAIHFKGAHFWQRPYLTFVGPENTVARVVVAIADDPEDGRYKDGFWVDGFQFEQKPYPTTYISGDEVGFPNEFPNAYLWAGSPHNSPSIRLEATRSGGRVHLLSELGFLITEFTGLGLIEPDNQIQTIAVDHGAVFSGSLLPEREWTVTGIVCEAGGIFDVHATRQRLVRAFSPFFGRPTQPVRFHYQLFDCATPISDTLVLDGVYAGGLDLKIDNHFTEDLDIDFVSPDPFIYASGGSAAKLDMNDGTLPDGQFGLPARDETNTWRLTTPLPEGDVWALTLGTDGNMYAAIDEKLFRWNGSEWAQLLASNGNIYALVATPDRYLYILGAFTSITSNPATFSHVARLNMLTGAVDNVHSTVLTGAGKVLRCGVYHFNGKLLVGGTFAGIGNSSGTITAANVAALDLATLKWEILGLTGLPGIVDTDGLVLTLDVSPVGNVVAGGRFQHEGALVAQNLAIIDLKETVYGWRTLNNMKWENDPTDCHIHVAKFSPDGLLWVGGRFNNSAMPDHFGAGGTLDPGDHSPLTNIGYILGVAGEIRNIFPDDPLYWRIYPVEQGTTDEFHNGAAATMCEVRDLTFDCRGNVFVVGLFDATLRAAGLGPVPTPSFNIRATTANFAVIGLQRTWFQPGIIFYPFGFSVDTIVPVMQIWSIEYGRNCYPPGPAFPFGGGIPASPNISPATPGVPANYTDALFLGTVITEDLGPFIVFPRRTVVDTQCSVNAKPVIRFLGPGRPKRITNRSTGSTIEFLDGTNLLPDEVLIIDLSGRIPRVLSNVSQNAYSYLRNVNQLAKFRLEVGQNQIDLLYDNLDPSGTPNPASKAWIQWKKRYESVDAAACF